MGTLQILIPGMPQMLSVALLTILFVISSDHHLPLLGRFRQNFLL